MKGEDLVDIPENIIYRQNIDVTNQKPLKSSFLIESLLSNKECTKDSIKSDNSRFKNVIR